MKIIPKNIRWQAAFSDRRALISLVSLIAVSVLFSICGIVMLAAEKDSDADECLPGQITEFSDDTESKEIVVSGNNSYLVHLKVDGKEFTHCYDKDEKQTVLDLLYRNDVYLNAEDTVNYDLSVELKPDMSVEVGRVTYEEVTERESIPFETKQILMSFALSSSLPTSLQDKYSSRLKNTAGSPGIREIKVKKKLVNGEVVETTKISSTVIQAPKDAVVYVDASHLLNVGGGAPTNYIKKLDCEFTAYSYDENGPSLTASGAKARVGYVAVDPKVIPMHSYLYVVLDNGFIYGYCYAKDTGGAIKGNIVDVFLPSDTDCSYFGRRQGTVYVISYGS
ncbi:MAG: G5 domain-containing protein [Clostridia bacterium]|nr:G5 domain-containing protein [Clostridia bacterium]